MSTYDSQNFKKLIKAYAQENNLKYTEARREYLIRNSGKYLQTKGLSLSTLVDVGTLNVKDADFLLEKLTQYPSDVNKVAIVGLTGTGKTVFNRALINDMSRLEQRIIVSTYPYSFEYKQKSGFEGYEEKPLASSDSNSPNNEGMGYAVLERGFDSKISFDDVVRAAVRMNPDYLIVDEFREFSATLPVACDGGHGLIAVIHAKDKPSLIQRMTSIGYNQPENELDFDVVIRTERVYDEKLDVQRFIANII